MLLPTVRHMDWNVPVPNIQTVVASPLTPTAIDPEVATYGMPIGSGVTCRALSVAPTTDAGRVPSAMIRLNAASVPAAIPLAVMRS